MSLAIGQYLMVIDDSGDPATARFPDRAGNPVYRVVEWKRDLIAVKVPGMHYYGGLGRPQAYSPAKYEVFRILAEEADGQVIVEPVLDLPLRLS